MVQVLPGSCKVAPLPKRALQNIKHIQPLGYVRKFYGYVISFASNEEFFSFSLTVFSITVVTCFCAEFYTITHFCSMCPSSVSFMLFFNFLFFILFFFCLTRNNKVFVLCELAGVCRR